MRAIKNMHTVLVEMAHLVSKDVHEGLEACGFSPLGVWRNDAHQAQGRQSVAKAGWQVEASDWQRPQAMVLVFHGIYSIATYSKHKVASKLTAWSDVIIP